MWIYSNNLDQVIRLAEIRSGRGLLIYSAGEGLINVQEDQQNIAYECHQVKEREKHDGQYIRNKRTESKAISSVLPG